MPTPRSDLNVDLADRRPPPFFIVGTPRSGTTLVQGILAAHSRLYIPPETFLFSKLIPRSRRYVRNGRILDRDGLRSVLGSSSELAPVVARLDEGVWDDLWRHAVNLCDLLDGLFTACASSSGKSRWGEKTPSHLWHWNDIDRCFPGCGFIAILRDGRDVVASMAKVPWAARSPWASAYRWKRETRLIEDLASALGPSRVHKVFYEELVGRPREVIEGVCRFLGVQYESAILSGFMKADEYVQPSEREWKGRNFEPIFTASIGAHKRLFSVRMTGLLTALMLPELRSLGYLRQADATGGAFLRAALGLYGFVGFFLQYGAPRVFDHLRRGRRA